MKEPKKRQPTLEKLRVKGTAQGLSLDWKSRLSKKHQAILRD